MSPRTAAPFPWGEAMGFGFGVLRLAPAAFWSLTPRELAAAFHALHPRAAGAPGRSALAQLMRAFPDEETT